jgi:hypothetical protein
MAKPVPPIEEDLTKLATLLRKPEARAKLAQWIQDRPDSQAELARWLTACPPPKRGRPEGSDYITDFAAAPGPEGTYFTRFRLKADLEATRDPQEYYVVLVSPDKPLVKTHSVHGKYTIETPEKAFLKALESLEGMGKGKLGTGMAKSIAHRLAGQLREEIRKLETPGTAQDGR